MASGSRSHMNTPLSRACGHIIFPLALLLTRSTKISCEVLWKAQATER